MTPQACRSRRRAAGALDVCIHPWHREPAPRGSMSGLWIVALLTLLFAASFGIDWRFTL